MTDLRIEVKQLPSSEEIIKLIECPICTEISMGPIWLCTMGHSTCNACRKQMTFCGICRKEFTRSRNFVLESIVSKCSFDCPYKDLGCNKCPTGEQIMNHINSCAFRKLKWVAWNQYLRLPWNAIRGGIEDGVSLYVTRAENSGSIIPGKIFEHNFLFGEHKQSPKPMDQPAIISYNGTVYKKDKFDVLTAPVNTYKWIPSQFGQEVPNAIPGGVSETGEQLYIGRVKIGPNVIIGKIQPSRKNCFIGTVAEVAYPSYYILVAAD